jgi:hypothetical protein
VFNALQKLLLRHADHPRSRRADFEKRKRLCFSQGLQCFLAVSATISESCTTRRATNRIYPKTFTLVILVHKPTQSEHVVRSCDLALRYSVQKKESPVGRSSPLALFRHLQNPFRLMSGLRASSQKRGSYDFKATVCIELPASKPPHPPRVYVFCLSISVASRGSFAQWRFRR